MKPRRSNIVFVMTDTAVSDELNSLLVEVERIIDLEAISEGMKRQSDAWLFRSVDRPPLTINFPCLKHKYSYKEVFEDPGKMLITQIEMNVLPHLMIKDDAVPAVRADYGVCIIPSAFGCEVRVMDDSMPWAKAKQLFVDGKLDPSLLGEPIFDKGLPAKVLETECFFLEKLEDTGVRIYLADTQGPFNLAHQIIGEKIFQALYLQPNEVKEILSKITEAYIQFTVIQKKLIGEPLTSGAHGWDKTDGPSGLWMYEGGVRLCEDSAALLSPRHYIEFCKDFNIRCLSPFNGGLWHSCGKVSHILSIVLDTPGVKAIHLGNPELYRFEDIRRLTFEKRVCLVWKDRIPYGADVECFIDRFIKALGDNPTGVIFSIDVESFEDAIKLKKAWVDAFYRMQ
ncbi:MAG: uroporphyrinogen decarboxylase family protein [Candidatus Bathyarchaeia archaeon]